MKCYDEWWLPHDMKNMGYMFEFCDKYCKERYGVKVDKVKLMTAFMESRFRKEMEEGHPKFLSQAAADSLKQWVDVDYDKDLKEFTNTDTEESEYTENQFYWIGWIYAYIHFMSKLPSKEIVKKLPVKEMLRQYHLGHEMNKHTYYEHIKEAL